MPLSAGQVATLAARGFPVDGDTGNSDDYYLDDGTFSSVVRVRDAEGRQWAVKVVDKLLILKHNKANAVLAEKTILLALDHCNIVKLETTFQDSTSLCTRKESGI
jgi:serine/threonine protein kinase